MELTLEQSEVKKPRSRPSAYRTIALGCLLVSLVGLMLGFTTNYIPSDSMLPGIKSGDHVLTMRRWLGYPLGLCPRRGDIIVFSITNAQLGSMDGEVDDKNKAGRQTLIKRVIGLPGDRIRIKDNVVLINGQALHEDYPIAPVINPAELAFYYADNDEITLKDDELFVMGDNRNSSDDSRFWGPLKRGDVLGKFVKVLYNEGPNGPNVLRNNSK